jgi:hypothetical protein
MRLSSGHAGPVAGIVFAVALLAGCGSGTNGAKSIAGLGPPETFRWCDQPITFAPPPPRWHRDAYGNGERRGIWFVKERSGGEAIIVAAVDLIGDRDRGAALRELLARIDAYEDRDLDRALTLARWRTDLPFVGNEAEVATVVNGALDRAMTGMTHQDRTEVRIALMDASDAAARLQIRLDDALASPAFDAERHSQPDHYQVNARARITIGGEPAERVDYTWRIDDKVLALREVHVMHGNHLFVASIQGADQKDFGWFDRVVESIAFPPDEPVTAR